jgi:hypothetical protein
MDGIMIFIMSIHGPYFMVKIICGSFSSEVLLFPQGKREPEARTAGFTQGQFSRWAVQQTWGYHLVI